MYYIDSELTLAVIFKPLLTFRCLFKPFLSLRFSKLYLNSSCLFEQTFFIRVFMNFIHVLISMIKLVAETLMTNCIYLKKLILVVLLVYKEIQLNSCCSILSP